MKTKSFELQVKEAGGETPRIVAYASTFHREPDSYGDVVAKGAFVESLEKIKSEGRFLPLLFGHRMDDPMMNIGKVVRAEEDENGLLVEAEFDMENPNAVKAHRDVLARTLTKLSFAFDVLDYGPVELEDGTKANELRKMEIFEVSLVPVPANQHAIVIDAKAGRRNSKADEDKLREALDSVERAGEVIRGLIAADDMEGDPEPEGGDEAKAAEAEELKRREARVKSLTEYIDNL